MALQEYKKKRQLGETPEPGITKHAVSSTKTVLHFVVQKHDASHLHYDFRLELQGVLKSWAVPKGPSLNPHEKRLAVMVEDHPIEYKDFEGIIPKGHYGAGKVMIWDKGTYEPADSSIKDTEKLLKAELDKGHLSIILHGKKLRGEFSLVKFKGDKNNEWLLIKKDDKFASTQDVLKKNKSIISGRSIDKINSIPAQAKKIAMPDTIKPMLATLTEKSFDSDKWLFEIKWDGFRIISFVKGKTVKLISRNNKDYTAIFEPVTKELEKLKIKAIFDGEMTVVDSKGRSHFELLQQFQKTGEGPLVYNVFDIIWLNGYDLTQIPLLERKNLLKTILPSLEHVHYSDHVLETGKDFFKIAKQENLEGIMAKKIDSHYEEGHRSFDWLKIKTHQRQEAVIVGFTEPKGSRKDLGALVLGVYEKGKLIYIGHTGGGLNTIELEDLKTKLDKMIQSKCPFETEPKTNAPVTWVKPILVCEVSFQEWTAQNMLRQPIFIGLRQDKSAKEVVRERASDGNKK
jgi:bifunctional non-homologous end joining protein LigD